MSRAAFVEKATLASERAKEFINSRGSMVTRARSLVSGDAQFFSIQPNADDLRRHLDSDSMHDKRDAMKRIIAQMCKGRDMSALFTDVVKNIHAPSIELRKLIYFYITHYADERPNEALLSISAFQKDLMDSSIHVRSLALRMLSSIRIPAIHPLVMVAVKKCSTDSEPLVRKTAAISLAQVHAISGGDEDTETMLELLQLLLADKCSEVAAAAALSFIEICPDKIQFIHRVYRGLCRSLVDCEEYGQVVLLHLLLRYARTQFLDPNDHVTCFLQQSSPPRGGNVKDDHEKSDGSGDSDDESSSSSLSTTSAVTHRDKEGNRQEVGEAPVLDPDHQLLLDSVKPLFMSLNSAVVVAATSVFYHCGPTAELNVCVQPLLRLLAGREEHQAIVLSAIHTVVVSSPESFAPYIKEFLLLPRDTREVRELKICIISKLVTESNFTELFREFCAYVHSFSVDCVMSAVRGLGLIAARLKGCAAQIMRLLVPLLSHTNSEVVSESIAVLRLLAVQGTNKNKTLRLVHRLLQQLLKGKIVGSSAKATVLWLVGENIQLHTAIAVAAPECFRAFAKNFAQETTVVKKQVLTLGCKICIFLDGESTLADRFRKLFIYVLELARFDEDYDVRDSGRFIRLVVDRQDDMFLALKRMLLTEKPLPQSSDPFEGRRVYQLGTMSHLFGNALFGYQELPEWPKVASDALLRGPPRSHHRGQYNENGNYDEISTLVSSNMESDTSSETYYSSSSSMTTDGSQTTTVTRSSSMTESDGNNSDNEAEDTDNSDIGSSVDKYYNEISDDILPSSNGAKKTVAVAGTSHGITAKFVVRHIDPNVATSVLIDSVSTPFMCENCAGNYGITGAVGNENLMPDGTVPSLVPGETTAPKTMPSSSDAEE